GESAPNPFPKTFNRILPPYRAHLKKRLIQIFWCAPYMGAKLIVLGNRFEKLLLQIVYLNNTYKTSL
ncbi:MAG: hypothetical protein WBK46_05660, partial [Ruminococcus flavefaciens]